MSNLSRAVLNVITDAVASASPAAVSAVVEGETVDVATERYISAAESRHQTLAYLSRYLFWLVMAVLLAGFSLVV